MKALERPISEDTAGGAGEGRQAIVSKCLRWNTGRESQQIKWKINTGELSKL